MSEFEEMSVKIEKRVGNESLTFQSWTNHKPINSWHFHQSFCTYWCQNNDITDTEVPQEGKTSQNKIKQPQKGKKGKETDNGSSMD